MMNDSVKAQIAELHKVFFASPVNTRIDAADQVLRDLAAAEAAGIDVVDAKVLAKAEMAAAMDAWPKAYRAYRRKVKAIRMKALRALMQ
jgi:hypothetical protein